MKFQNPSIHPSKVSNSTEKWKNQSKFQNSVFLSQFDGTLTKVTQVIYSSAPTKYEGSISNSFGDINYSS